MMLPPNPRERTTTPNTCPSVCLVRYPATPSVVATSMLCLLRFEPGHYDPIRKPISPRVDSLGGRSYTIAALAQMAELVDALVSGTSAARRGGSSPLLGTNALAPRRSTIA